MLFASLRSAPQCPAAVLTRVLCKVPPNIELALVDGEEELASTITAFWKRRVDAAKP